MSLNLIQEPQPGSRRVYFAGDTVTFTLTLSEAREGRAWFRTNAGHGAVTRREIIREAETGDPPLARDWFDVPMERRGNRVFTVTVPLCEPGHFEGKCLFVPEGEAAPLWPGGENTVLNVKPPECVAGNGVYNAFVRQFGPNKKENVTACVSSSGEVKGLDCAGFSVIPPSGTFRDLAAELDFILGDLFCGVLQLLPVHPTPTTYGRMGRFGSPYASLSFTAVDPALARFDPQATPMEQFIELVDAVHAREGRIVLDMAIGHTGWAATLHETHPEWLVRGPDGRIEAPGAWGVVWEDLTKLDYGKKELWRYMAEVFLTWCRRGVDGFRCDAGYMIPVEAWRYMTARVRDEFPDTVFFLEGLGGKIVVTRDLLNRGGFDWAYSELFQNYDRGAIEYYLPGAFDMASTDGVPVHFAETHDNLRLAARGTVWARMRTALCALLSHQGSFAFANGVEWLATEKIDVHDASSLNWGAAENQVNEIRLLNRILALHPCFTDGVTLSFVEEGGGNFVAVARERAADGKKLLVLANLDDRAGVRAAWNGARAGLGGAVLYDLLSDRVVDAAPCKVALAPGEVLCLSPDAGDLEIIKDEGRRRRVSPARALRQRLRREALSIWRHHHKNQGLGRVDPESLADALFRDPLEFCRSQNPASEETLCVSWRHPRDLTRMVMIPAGHNLLVTADSPFECRIGSQEKTLCAKKSLRAEDGRHFAILPPIAAPEGHARHALELVLHGPEKTEHHQSPLLYLSDYENAPVQRVFRRGWLLRNEALLLGTNGRGGMMRARARWGELQSRYDALLAANLSPDFPEDRRVLLTRVRGWVVFQGHSHEINAACLDAFAFAYSSRGFWRFTAPTGQGSHVVLLVSCEMAAGDNRVRLTFLREHAENGGGRLPDPIPVRLILRPDVEDRSFHELTKAYTGPEQTFPASVAERPTGFDFAPHPGRRLAVDIRPGAFFRAPEWRYMVHLEDEAVRGQDPANDLFSPGYFAVDLLGGEFSELSAAAVIDGGPRAAGAGFSGGAFSFPRVQAASTKDAAAGAMEHYMVSRGEHASVVAGYPWFLDWGRDSLIFVRGLVAARNFTAAESVLTLFGRFEDKGTLPNCILGEKPGNRDTSDAPLWFITVCADLTAAQGGISFLDAPAGKRTVRQVLVSIAEGYLAGTPNGVRVDPASGLVWSPPHFSWMDTNHPAATPREGYPVEIQALWHAALRFLASVSSGKQKARWEDMRKKVRRSIREIFFRNDLGHMADCLHAPSGTPASQASADDALRPNQLLAVTLGAITEKDLMRKIVAACEELVVPGAIRSLADRPVTRPIPAFHNGMSLNDPFHPYRGTYEGDEDTRRKPAYHNGTAWAWLFPSFCEAYFLAYGEAARRAALSWLASATRVIAPGACGHVPEIIDGDFPHTPRGCDAQAWSASELYRVCRLLANG